VNGCKAELHMRGSVGRSLVARLAGHRWCSTGTQAVELRAQGMSWGEIAKKLGTTLTSVGRAWKTKNSDTG
jgi:hypothetical protein